MLIVVLGAAALAGLVCASWTTLRLWQALPRRNSDLVLF
jgi:hypothetical protein